MRAPHALSSFRPGLVVADSVVSGRGLVTTQRIEAGETVMEWGGTPYTRADLEAGRVPAGSSYSFVDEDLLLAVPDDDLDYFVNHSCDPGVWMSGELTVVARRTLEPGDEITGDYALWEGDPDYVLEPCRCGSATCRGRVTGDDWRLPDVQRAYDGHFLPYLQRRVDATRGPEHQSA